MRESAPYTIDSAVDFLPPTMTRLMTWLTSVDE